MQQEDHNKRLSKKNFKHENKMQDLRKKLYNEFSIIPLQGKAPILSNWTKYSNEKINYSKIENHTGNFGIVCGFDGLEVIDIDNHFDDANKLFEFISDNFDLSKFLIIQTGGGGYHIYFKCEKIGRNQKLAQRINSKGKPEVLVETRGQGGQVVFYDNIIHGNINAIPRISIQERVDLIQICTSLNEVEKKKVESTANIKQTDKKPGELYNEDFQSIQDTFSILRNAGWLTTDNKHWKRPHKETKGISATFGKVGNNKFYVFSSNAYPFESETSYSMFAVKTILEHNGNYSDCAKELSKKYSIKPVLEKKKTTSNNIPQKSNDKWLVLEQIINEWSLDFRYNELTKVLDVKVGKDNKYQGTQLIVGDIIREMETVRGIKTISASKLNEMIMNRSICRVYNPVTDFFKSLPKWNGKDNIKELCKYIELENDEEPQYFENMLKKHLIRTIKCAKIDRYINRMVLVYHGGQEIGKSMFFRWLMNTELYYEEPISPQEKDSILALGRYMLVNLDELDSLNKKDVAKLKAYVSRGEIVKRVAYGRHDERFSRIASFVGSTNKSDLLADTSNTRWIILKVKSFNWKEYTKKIDPLQIWAQAVSILKKDTDAGELTITEKRERERRNTTKFLETSIERELLYKHFEETTTPQMTATDIKMVIEQRLYPVKVNFNQLVRELKRIYGEPLQTSVHGKRGRFYAAKHNLEQSQGHASNNYYETEERTLDGSDSVPF